MFYLQHFKNFDKAELDDERAVTLLVGPNGAGKSNLIEAIELLSFLSSGRPLYEITDYGREGGLEVRGGLDACASHGHQIFTLGQRSQIMTTEGKRLVTYEISVRVGVESESRIIDESLTVEGWKRPIFRGGGTALRESGDNRIDYDDYNSRSRKKPAVWVPHSRAALPQYARFAVKNKKLPETLEIVDAVLKTLATPSVFDPNPKLMRDYERESQTRLARNGSNLSAALADLFRTRYVKAVSQKDGRTRFKRVDQSDVAERILRRISQLPDESFTAFDFIRTKAKDVMFGFKTSHDDVTTTARILSDGTLRALAILTALETSPSGKRLILEEFDNGIHPSRVQIISEALFDCAARNKLRVVATTQNPATLNALADEQYESVLLVVHDTGQKFARLLPLTELPGYIEFMEQGRLGDLITRRIYEKHLRSDYEGERKEEMERWLQSLP
jgi:predicted ATPase